MGDGDDGGFVGVAIVDGQVGFAWGDGGDVDVELAGGGDVVVAFEMGADDFVGGWFVHCDWDGLIE